MYSRIWLRPDGTPQLVEAALDRAAGTVDFAGRNRTVEQLDAGIPVDGTVYGTLLNFRGTLAALGEAMRQPPYKEPPKAPVLYLKPWNTWRRCGDTIPVPEGVEALEMGGTLGVVIGRDARRVREADALDHVAGYVVVNDVTIPHASLHRPSIRQRCQDGFCPIGPWVAARADVGDPGDLEIRIHVDGELRARNTTANLVRPLACLLAEVTAFMTLSAGDVLLVGLPDNAPEARAGQTVRVEIDGVGWTENRLVPAREPEGERP
ncbi:fumarylacetoacetate hydrolase family protein [Oceanibacterium hippocampi]|uniref:Homoprotocatechuate catabolism bifunctional isomerase/decarboxylase n=1 Tax=Oceanibacterium hippocampi TaxID=745714 RepID=A0A1Y5TV21_9PROT|nr:fumarylacetoacetate hydrolase family protein [Oceanibacterium hippocampi]SLN70924.1 Homoprotocatechuate catabolism bifunctional isomerase/decarboxylase [Oceanibacterium hippocampi]